MSISNQEIKNELDRFMCGNNFAIRESTLNIIDEHKISFDEFKRFYTQRSDTKNAKADSVRIGVELSANGMTLDSMDVIHYICVNSSIDPNLIFRVIVSIKDSLASNDSTRSKVADCLGNCLNRFINELPAAMTINSIAKNNTAIFKNEELIHLDILKLLLKSAYKDYSDSHVFKFLEPLEFHNPLDEKFKGKMEEIMLNMRADIYATIFEYWPGLENYAKFYASVTIRRFIKKD